MEGGGTPVLTSSLNGFTYIPKASREEFLEAKMISEIKVEAKFDKLGNKSCTKICHMDPRKTKTELKLQGNRPAALFCLSLLGMK